MAQITHKYVISLLIIFVATGCAINEQDTISLYNSSDKIKSEILLNTPIGSNLSDVNKFIKTQSHRGIVSPPYEESKGARVSDADDPQIITISGAHSIKLLLGRYRDPKWLFLFKIDVYVTWAFDNNNEVIDFFVYKYNRPS